MSIPRQVNAIRKVLLVSGRVKPRDVTTQDAAEEFFSELRSGNGSFSRNPSPSVAVLRVAKSRLRAVVYEDARTARAGV